MVISMVEEEKKKEEKKKISGPIEISGLISVNFLVNLRTQSLILSHAERKKYSIK